MPSTRFPPLAEVARGPGSPARPRQRIRAGLMVAAVCVGLYAPAVLAAVGIPAPAVPTAALRVGVSDIGW